MNLCKQKIPKFSKHKENYTLMTRMKTILCTLLSIGSMGLFAQQNAIDFDNIDDYAAAPNASGLIANSSALSMTMWVYPTNPSAGWPDFEGFAGFRNDANGDFYLLQLNSTTVEARFRNSSGVNYDLTYSGLNLNTWNHFVMTYDGTTFSLYHNGALQTSIAASGTISNTALAFNVGRVPFSTNFYLDGKLDEVSLWNTALTQTDVTNIYTGCGINSSSAGLKLLYNFNQGVANGNNAGVSTLIDGAGNINASLSGMSLSGTSSNFVNGVLGGGSSSISQVGCDSYTWAQNGMTYTTSGTYSHIIPNGSANGCDSIVYLNLTISSPNDINASVTACDSYTWNINGNTYTSTTTVTETLMNSQGCPYDYTINITIKNSSSSTDVIQSCEPITWMDGNTYSSSTNTPTHVLTNSVGCDSTITLDLTINSVINTVTDNGDGSFTADATGVTYQWVDCNNSYAPIAGETSQTFTPTQNGSYAVIVDNSDCADTSECVQVATIGLYELTQNFKVYPIPATDELIVQMDIQGAFTYQITDLLGKVIQTEVLNKERIDIQNLPTGTYFLEISNGEKFVYRNKFVKE